MAQSVWHIDDIAQIGQTLVTMAPSPEFAAGVAAVCSAVGARVKLPEWPKQAPVVMIDAQAVEVSR